MLPLRDTVLFPQSVLPLAAGRPSSLSLIEDAARSGQLIGVFTQRDPATEDPQGADLYRIGTLATIHKVLKQPDGTVRLVVQGLARVRLAEVTQVRPYLKARVEEPAEVLPPAGDLETEALVRNASTLFRQIVALSPLLPDELASVIQNVSEPGRLADVIAASLPALSTKVKQELLETTDVKARLARLAAALTKEAEVLELGSKIQSQVESEVGKSQREFYLREQLKAIQKELGQTDDRAQELEELRQKIEAAGMTEEAKKEALRELDRLSKMPPAAAEYTVARTYLDWLVALPWSKETTDNLDIAQARTVLDEDHWGLDKVKDRILEYLAVKSMRPAGKDPILCFVGPPGVGKTSLGRSIARALGRKFHRISLGGMRDEAEIRGHRRTYIGALPGQIIQGLTADGIQESRVHAGRDRQARHGFPRRPRLGAARGARSRAERGVPGPLRRRRVRSLEDPVHHDGQRARPGAAGASRPDGDHRDRGLHRRGEDPHRQEAPRAQAGEGPRAHGSRDPVDRRRRCGSWSGTTRARPGCAISSGRSRR